MLETTQFLLQTLLLQTQEGVGEGEGEGGRACEGERESLRGREGEREREREGWSKVLRVLEVQEVLVGVVIGHNVGQEGVHDVDSDVPGVCVGQQDLRVLEVLVVCQDVREGGSRALWRTAPS